METYRFFTINKEAYTEDIIYSKKELFKKIPSLEKRDLYLVDSNFSFKISSILTKDKTILIKLDYIKGAQNYEGIDKIKLSNVIQDPSFVREVLSYEIARKYMPAGEANYTNLFINDTLIGLYTNVEASYPTVII